MLIEVYNIYGHPDNKTKTHFIILNNNKKNEKF